jgi:flagellar hook protein FlgE
MMRTGVSGMSAQANRLSTVADNIANSGTTGYKRSRAEFATMVLPSTAGQYASGAVTTAVQRSIASQGVLQYTTSATDLAVNGDGFFIVQSPSGQPFLTRAGAFVPDGSGRFVNAAGYQLMGYNFANGEPAATANGFDGLEPVTISAGALAATPSTAGAFTANFPADAAIVAAADLPSANAASASYSAKSSLVVYDNLGGEKLLDLYFTKSAAGAWEVAVFDKSQAAAGTGFPYASGPLATTTLNFDPTSGALTGASADSIAFTVPGGAAFELDLGDMSQLASPYAVLDAGVNGSPPSAIEEITIAQDGTVYGQFGNGALKALYRIPLATAQSPDQFIAVNGNVFAESPESGGVRIGFANEQGFGGVISGALESSNVDIAEELTNMIESQRSYTANSKVFQTGSELMDVLVNLKR